MLAHASTGDMTLVLHLLEDFPALRCRKLNNGQLSDKGFIILYNPAPPQKKSKDKMVPGQFSTSVNMFLLTFCSAVFSSLEPPALPSCPTDGGEKAAAAIKVTSSQTLIQRQKGTIVPLVLICLRAEKLLQNLPSRFPLMPC